MLSSCALRIPPEGWIFQADCPDTRAVYGWPYWRKGTLPEEICIWHWAGDVILILINPPSNSERWELLVSFYSKRISNLFRMHSTIHIQACPIFSSSLTVCAFPSRGNALLTLSNGFFLVIPGDQPWLPLQNFLWPAILHYFFSSPQPNHSSLFLPLFPQHSTWDLSCNDKYIHCNFPFTYQKWKISPLLH